MEKDKKSKIKKVILIILAIPFILILGLVLLCCGIILWEKFFNIPVEPKIKHAEFSFELVYKYNGVEYSLEDKVTCNYEGIDYAFDGGNFRVWSYEYEDNKEDGYYYIDKENNPHLYICVPFEPRYYMGEEDPINSPVPYIEFDFLPGEEISEEETVENVDFEIIEWNVTEPLKNNFE